MFCLYSILSKGFSVCSQEKSSLSRCLNGHVWFHCPATCYLVNPVSDYSPPCLSLPTVASLLCLKQHPLPAALSILFSLFHCSISPSSALITIWYIIYFRIYFYLFYLLSLPTLDSMKIAISFFFFFWSPASRAVCRKTGAQALFFGMNELIHGHFLAPGCFVAWSRVVSPEGDKKALWCKYLHLIINMSTEDVRLHKLCHFRSINWAPTMCSIVRRQQTSFLGGAHSQALDDGLRLHDLHPQQMCQAREWAETKFSSYCAS